MNGSVPDTSPGIGFGSSPKSPFLSSPFGYYFPTPMPAPPPLSADSYPMILDRQKETLKPFSGPGPESLPFNNNPESTQLPNDSRYSPSREFPPNAFYPPMRDMPYPPMRDMPYPPMRDMPYPPMRDMPYPPMRDLPYPPMRDLPYPPMRDMPYSSYTEILPFADCMGIGYPMMPGRFFTYVEQYQFPNQPSIGEHPLFNKGIGSTVPGFGEDFATRPRFDKSYPPQPGTFEQQMFGAMPGFCPDLQFCRYSGCGDSTKSCEYPAANGFNGFVSYSETVNVLSFPSMTNLPKSKTEHLVEQSADGCVLISKSKVCSNQNYTSMFRQLSIKRNLRNKQLQNDQLVQE